MLTAEDREIRVSPGEIVVSRWIPIDTCCLGSRQQRSIGDIERKYQRLLQMGDQQPWPPLVGRWRGDRFEVMDGGHTLLALMALGKDQVFVAWLERS